MLMIAFLTGFVETYKVSTGMSFRIVVVSKAIRTEAMEALLYYPLVAPALLEANPHERLRSCELCQMSSQISMELPSGSATSK
jgi:hypothetical protein